MSSCSKTPDIMAWYEKEGALDLPHIQGCADCQKEKESLADFYQATRELKNSVPAIPKSVERRLNRLSASSIILEATRRSLNFWAAVAKIESILLLLMGLALIGLLGKAWQPVHQNPAPNMKEISMPAESLEKSEISRLNERKTEILSTPAPDMEKSASVHEIESPEPEAQSSEENLSSASTEEITAAQENTNPQNTPEEDFQVLPEENQNSHAELSAQDSESLKADLKNSGEKTYEIGTLPVEVKMPAETDIPDSSGEMDANPAQETDAVIPVSSEEVQTASVSLEPENTQENENMIESENISETHETDAYDHSSEPGENTATDYSKVLESASDVLTTSAYQDKVSTSIFSHSQHNLTAGQNARSRSRPSLGVEWRPGIAKMLPVFLGNGYILDKNTPFHPSFKPALDEMNEMRSEKTSFSKPENQNGQKKPFISSLNFKDALKNNQNLEIPEFEGDSGNQSQMDSNSVQAIHPEDKENVSEWKTNSQKNDMKGKNFNHHPGISQDAIEKLDPGKKNKPHQKFHPPKEKGPKPPGGKVPKFKAPIGKAFNPPGSKTPIPPGGKGPPPPGGN